MLNLRFTVLTGMVLSVAASRLLPHPPNFTPVGAIALFGGAYFAGRGAAFFVPLAAMLLSDLVIGLHRGMYAVYGCFALTVCLGLWLRGRRTLPRVAGATLASSLLFFVVTNFSVWAMGHLYPKTFEGLVICYLAAIPFFRNTLLGDTLYAAVLFGGFALAERLVPATREATGAVGNNG